MDRVSFIFRLGKSPRKSQREEYVGKKVLDTKLNVKYAGRLEFELSTWGKVDFPVSIGGIFIPMVLRIDTLIMYYSDITSNSTLLEECYKLTFKCQ